MMANDINGIGRGPGMTRSNGANSVSTDRGGASAASSEAAVSGVAGDRVSLTGASEAMKAAEVAAREASGIDAARVEEVRNAIAEGRYRIDTAALAERLIADESLLG